MPKLEPKQVQRDLEKGQLWPVYWIYGPEQMKSRELLRRIRTAVLGEETAQSGMRSFAEDALEGAEATAASIVDSAQSLSLGGGVRFVVVRDAHLVKDPDALRDLLGPIRPKEELASVCVFLSKDLDARRKFSKLLVEKAAVVSCEEVPEDERDAWIGYLAKRRGLELPDEAVAQLRTLDPWTLDLMERELEKFELAGQDLEILLGGASQDKGSQAFLNAFLGRSFQNAMSCIEGFASKPEEALPLLGLLAWNARFVALLVADRERGTRTVKLSPFLADRLNGWARKWKLPEAIRLQEALSEIDFGIKQTGALPLGLWSSLVSEFCPQPAPGQLGALSSPAR